MKEYATIKLTQFINHPPSKVWRALTTPELIARWWAPGDVRPVVGHQFTLDMGKWGKQPCEVKAVEEERLLVYSFALDTTLTWKLTPEGNGTRLDMEHAGFDLDSPMGRKAYEGMSGGWPTVLQRIEGALQDASDSAG